ncbi:hypothetical protein FRX31_025458 [Thalictrum thalictroides]|uniref:Reverse transcriptase zinc-binding domain-containing protein n=1 Tax=Thalictrum thalictroides TaxID=46969 RepID=A0A7J6VLB2_THATH|nr:hypothetical protein FRX31_025458 [Thalictrum thalictroides]
MWQENGEGGNWQLNFRRNLREWEMTMFEDLISKIEVSTLVEEDDTWIWRWSKKARFTVKSMFKHLVNEKLERLGNRVVFPSSLVWDTALPMNIKLFFWTIFLGRTLTRQTLVHRGLAISTAYPLCNLLPETVNHLFLHCPLVLELWDWPHKRGNDLMMKVWMYLPYASAWVIRKHRNGRVFDDKVPHVSKMIMEIKALTWYWCSNWSGRSRFKFRDLIVNWDDVLSGSVVGTLAATGIV